MKWVKRGIITILLLIFLFSVGTIAITLYQYRLGDGFYARAAEQFLREKEQSDVAQEQSAKDGKPQAEIAPVVVDFEALRMVNPDVEGWLYCEDTVINYPILHGTDNDTYLHHLYDRSYCYSGSLFVEAENKKDFTDYNTIIYGHNMRNDTMFGTLDQWGDQAYYEEHPIFWILTPEQDYRIEIIGAYTTSAYSDTYTIFDEEGQALDEYLAAALSQSAITAKEAPESGSRYLVLSTCAYAFSNARFVIHGKLVPVDSAGGVYREKTGREEARH